MSYYFETDPFTGETSSFGGMAEAAAEYHNRGETCPFDCSRCDISDGYDFEEYFSFLQITSLLGKIAPFKGGDRITVGPYPVEEARQRFELIPCKPYETVGIVYLTDEEAHAMRNGGVE